ncbi:MAG TPA: GerMN domain-containing protein [Thermoanaerobaculia bacterium]|nr:GerMN domain-containing protein [Thermoanaerobaculia bacterium]
MPSTRALVAAMLACIAAISACRKERAVSDVVALANKVESRTIQLFFESPDLLLVPETRLLSLPANQAAALSQVVAELLKGSANTAVPRLFPEDTVVRGAYLLPEGNAVVDLGGQTLTDGWNTGSHTELMAAYSLVHTLSANFEIRRVRILVNGQPVATLAGHVAIDRPLLPSGDAVKR